MADTTLKVRIKHRSDTEENWTSKDPVLLDGEIGYIKGTNKYKKGNGSSKWSELPLLEDLDTDEKAKLDNIDPYAKNTPFIIGTQTAKTGTWTGTTTEISSLEDGQSILYWLPYDGSGNATLNLTLADGSKTGALNCYRMGTSRLTTHYSAGSLIRMSYRKNAKINGGSTTYTGWWADADYSGDTYDRTRYSQPVKCDTTAIVAGNVIVGSNGLYHHLKLGTAFDVTYPILWAGNAISASATSTNTYMCIPTSITTTQSMTLTAYKPVFIKGNLSGTTFTPVSTTPLTQTVPTSADEYEYILLGIAYSTTSFYLLYNHPIFAYKGSSFGQISGKDITGLSASGKTITYTRGDGSTGTITTQDTTYSTGTASTSGLTKLYTGTGTATDGAMTQAALKTALDSKAASSHTHNYAGSSSAGGAANTAVKLQTARTVSSAGDFDMSFKYDGSANSSATLNYYNTTSWCGNKNNYPFHRFAKLDTITGSYMDKASTFLITQDYESGSYGIVRIVLRTNSSTQTSNAKIEWIVRKGFSTDSVQIGLYNVAGKTYADAFLKHSGAYTGTVIRNMASGSRGGISRTWSLVASKEVDNTTASDKLTSVEVYTTVASAATTLHNQAYTNVVSGVDVATVSYANTSGAATSATKLSTARKINGVAFDGTKDIDNVVYKTKAEYDALVKAGKLDKNAMYVTTDETDGVSEADTKMWNISSSLAKQGKYLSYSDQNDGKYLSLMNSSDNTAVAHAKLMDGESGEGMDVDADKVKTVDSKGILVEALGETTAQALIDEVAKRVLDLSKETNDLTGRMTTAEESITSLNSDLPGRAKIVNISSLASIGDIFKTYSKNGSIPVIGIINWDVTLAPDRNVTIAFVWNYLIVAISSSGCIYTASPNAATWQKRN